MKRSLSVAISLFVLLHTSNSQQVKSAPNRLSNDHFRWSQSKAEELDYERTIARSTILSASEKVWLLSAIEALVRPFMDDNEIASENELAQLASNTRMKLVDLNSDGIPDVLAQPSDYKLGCGATGNCALWVFEKTSAGYKLILDTRDRDGIGGIELLTVAETRTEGFRDLVLASHISASEKSLEVYRFKNGSYRKSDCYLANWEYVSNGYFHSSKKPLITQGCS